MEKTEWVTHYHCEIGCVNSMFRSLSCKVLFVVKSLDKCNAAKGPSYSETTESTKPPVAIEAYQGTP